MTRTVHYDPENLIDDVAVVLLAAGSGERLGASRPKAFVGLAGEAMLVHSLRAFEQHDAVDSIVVVVPEDWIGPTEVLIDDVGCDKVSSLEIGGACRAASVRNGLAAVADRRGTAVLVHDAARPVVPSDVIDRVLAPLAEGADAVVPALPVVDTIKQVDADGVVVDTPDRSMLRAAQTPQACRSSELHRALDNADAAALAGMTDDAAAVASVGGVTRVVAGDARLHKITTADDHARAEASMAPATAEAAAARDVGDDSAGEDDEPLDDDDLTGAQGAYA